MEAGETSKRRTAQPFLAHKYPMWAPMVPAPRMTTEYIFAEIGYRAFSSPVEPSELVIRKCCQ